MHNSLKTTFKILPLLLLASCQMTPNKSDEDKFQHIEPENVAKSYLAAQSSTLNDNSVQDSAEDKAGEARKQRFSNLPTMPVSDVELAVADDFENKLDDIDAKYKISSNKLALANFIHYAFGEMLSIDYVLDDATSKDAYQVSLDIKSEMTARKLFVVVKELLEQRGYSVLYKNNLLYIVNSTESQQKDFSYGIGKKINDLPAQGRDVFQIVPLLYSRGSEYSLMLRQLASVKVSLSKSNNLLFIEGARGEVVKALEFINIMDKPNAAASHIGLLELVYTDADTASNQLKDVLANESINIGINQLSEASAVLVPITNKNIIVVFAKSQEILNRIKFWAEQLDKSDASEEVTYFIYKPNYARAMDLGDSLSNILDVRSSSSSRKSSANNPNKASQATSKRTTNIDSNLSDMQVSVDERSNTLILSGTRNEYKKLLPLLKSLDVLPKQVMLEVVISEVTLRDDFKQGVEFAFNDGRYAAGTKGALGLGNVGGFSYSLTGINYELQFALSQDNSLVNVLSRPSVVVRDGVSASISVGTDIPTVGSTTTDPLSGDRETTEIVYRKTGIELSVTPTVNSQGVVLMVIDQKISNTTDSGVTTGGSPSIFERSITTEVVAASGQTVILGGLISKNRTVGESKVPIFGDIPLLGNLFRVDSDLDDKTELVVMVTPKIINRQEEWDDIKLKFFDALDNISADVDTSPSKQ